MNTMETLTQILLLTLTAVLLYILYKRALRLLTRDRVSANYGHIFGVSWSPTTAEQSLIVDLDMPEAGTGTVSFERDGKPVGPQHPLSFDLGGSRHDFKAPEATSASGFMLILTLPNQTIRRGVSRL